MATGTYISINTSKIGSVSAEADKIGREMETTRDTLKKLQNELSQAQNILDIYFQYCSDDVIPKKRLRQQSKKMNEIVGLLAEAEQLANDANNKLNTKTSALKLAVAAMSGLSAAGYTSALSVISGVLSGETDCGDDYAYVGEWEADISNKNIKISHKFKIGSLWAVEAYTKDNNFDASVWPSGYNRGDGCSVASLATAISALGIQALPKDIYKYNGDTNNCNWNTIAKKYSLSIEHEGHIADKNLSLAQQQAKIDAALKKYIENPDTYTPPIIGFTKGYNLNNHYIVVYGKNEDGSYRCIDSSGLHITKYQVVDQDYNTDKKKKVFQSNLNQIIQYHK